MTQSKPHPIKPDTIQSIIAVASGKGGVGKSTVAVNLALGLAKTGAKVGLLDADIYGPSQPTLLGITDKAKATAAKSLQPIMAHGLATMSIGYLIDTDNAVAWRGPMASGALQQLLRDTDWPELDYLIIDLPPGTGDIQLTLVQKIPLTAAVVVTTPQDLALVDVRKALNLFNKVRVPVLGIIENMSCYQCPQCGHNEALFGQGGGASLADDQQLKLLAQVPLTLAVREANESGEPVVVQSPQDSASQAFFTMSQQLVEDIKHLNKKNSRGFPKIVVES